jgi:hypothetical protein
VIDEESANLLSLTAGEFTYNQTSQALGRSVKSARARLPQEHH